MVEIPGFPASVVGLFPLVVLLIGDLSIEAEVIDNVDLTVAAVDGAVDVCGLPLVV